MKMAYFENNRSAYKLPPEYDALHVLIDDQSTNLFEILDRLNQPKYLLRIVKHHYETFKKLDLNKPQRQTIVKWLKETSTNFNFKDMLSYNGFKSFNFKNNESKRRFSDFKLIMFFYDNDLFSFELTEDFLINALEFYPIKNGFGENSGFLRIIAAIRDKTKLRERIVSNIENGIFSLAMHMHINYALENNYDETLNAIGKFYKETKEFGANSGNLNLYIEKTEDFELLKECSEDTNTYSTWQCLELLWQKGRELVFIRAKAIEALGNNESKFKETALKMLFRLRDEYALTYFVENYHELISELSFGKIREFNTVKPNNYELLEQLFHKVYSTTDEFDFHSGNEFTENLLIGLSKEKAVYEKIKGLLNKIKMS